MNKVEIFYHFLPKFYHFFPNLFEESKKYFLIELIEILTISKYYKIGKSLSLVGT
jgi:hypothetical protein